MVDSEDQYFIEKASSVQSMILYDCDGETLSKSISPSRPVSVFMMKPRLCPSRDHSSPVKTFILGFGQVLSDQPAASRLEHYKLAGDAAGLRRRDEFGDYSSSTHGGVKLF
ncbi:hypothetical protein F2Q69_00003392 [Brassica cretica]|uniref:Uncharacterized protein n=1 Tax=Brassica cretica TaxID=69181 RepID=A0A8S9NY78_BRACR|nr:hypothetical protein F2Q69_00003392 [Brassica cretica]